MLEDLYDREDLDAEPAPTTRKKKYVKKTIRKQFPCSHCGEILDFPSFFCECCNQHSHALFYSPDPKLCGCCYDGLSRQGQARLRALRQWRGYKFQAAASDQPEWHDMLRELNCSTIMLAWGGVDTYGG